MSLEGVKVKVKAGPTLSYLDKGLLLVIFVFNHLCNSIHHDSKQLKVSLHNKVATHGINLGSLIKVLHF